MNAGAISNRAYVFIALGWECVDLGCAALHGARSSWTAQWPGIRLANHCTRRLYEVGNPEFHRYALWLWNHDVYRHTL